MKKIIWLLLAWMVPVMAQQETLIGGSFENGGYGGAMIQFCQMKGSSAILVGGRGGWIVNHVFVLGGGGYGLVTNISADKNALDPEVSASLGDRDLYLQVGMGGVMLEYYFRPQKLLHFSLHSFIGGGNAGYITHKMGHDDWDDDEYQDDMVAQDNFFFVEPGVTMTLNVTSFMRLGAGASYRYVSGVDLAGLSNGDLSGAGLNLFINFGSF